MGYVDNIVEAFGGVRAMARVIEKPKSTVGSWVDRGSIPDSEKNAVLVKAQELGLALGPADFFPVISHSEDAA